MTENDKEKNWFDAVDEMIAGDFVKFEDGDEKILKIVSNPIAGPIEFAQADGTKKVNHGLQIDVLVDPNPEIKQWTITSKSLMAQLKAICFREGILANVAGSVFRVTASGTGMQRKYFVKLLSKPAAAKGPTTATTAATATDDKGVQWLEKQKTGAK